MATNTAFDPAVGFEYVGACLQAIGERRYRDALTLLDEGINMQLKSPQDINAGELLKHIA